mmetsp:Transcript_5291/g.11078  ORF Transcript_5291/g.11078 Transcript_5291/m.11078 type:complete len:109 (+) Transcript_5291:220-546(+)
MLKVAQVTQLVWNRPTQIHPTQSETDDMPSVVTLNTIVVAYPNICNSPTCTTCPHWSLSPIVNDVEDNFLVEVITAPIVAKIWIEPLFPTLLTGVDTLLRDSIYWASN